MSIFLAEKARRHIGSTHGEQLAAHNGDQGHKPDRERTRIPAAFGRMGAGAREKAVDEVVDEYIVATICSIQCEYETGPVEQRLRKISHVQPRR